MPVLPEPEKTADFVNGLMEKIEAFDVSTGAPVQLVAAAMGGALGKFYDLEDSAVREQVAKAFAVGVSKA